MENSSNKSNSTTNIDISAIDIKHPEFYDDVHAAIECDMARMKKCVDVMMDLRLTAAEVEVETAALFHAELWYDLLDIQNIREENSENDVQSKDTEEYK